MKFSHMVCLAIAPALTLTGGTAIAQTTLDFAGNICGVAGNAACGNGSQIGQNYGDSAGVIDVSYRSINAGPGTTFEAFLRHWSGSYGDLTSVVYGGANATQYISEITFTPFAGMEVALLGFEAGCYLNRTSCRTLNFSVASIGGTAIAGGSTPTLHPGHATVAVNSGYFTDGIVLRWGPDAYDVGLDNIRFDVRAVGQQGAVPEPATWAMMIIGFGVVGHAMRRRQRGPQLRQAV